MKENNYSSPEEIRQEPAGVSIMKNDAPGRKAKLGQEQIQEQVEEQEIDLLEWACYLWKKRRLLLKLATLGGLVGLVIALSMPKEYATTVRLVPETEDVSKKANSLGGLAAMAGINLNTTTSTDAISPDLYPDVVKSIPFLLELFPVKVAALDRGDSLTLYTYLHDHQRQAWWNYPLQAPFKAWGAIRQLFSTPEEKSDREIDSFHLTSSQANVIKALQRRIGVSVDKKTFVITVSVQMQDPVISARLAEVVVAQLQAYITAYRTRKAKNDLEFTRTVFAEARDAYYRAQQAYAAFEDANRNIISASYRTEQERLKNEMTVTFNVYNTLAQKLEQDKLRVQERMPVFTVIEPPSVPLRAASPKKIIILAGCIFLGLAGAVAYLFFRNLWTNVPQRREDGKLEENKKRSGEEE